MEVKHSKSFKNLPNYSIEWGYGTWSKDWEEKDFAIRNRYNKEDGGFNVRGSAEAPWCDFKRMILESIEEEQFSNKELKVFLKAILKYFLKNLFRR